MLTVCIQAGGQSSRMGEDKALKAFLGRPLIQRVVERLTPIADEMIVTTNHPEDYRFLDTSTGSGRSLRLVSDLKPGRGALGGLYTAITSASRPTVAVAACDMPFASPTLLRVASRILIEEEVDVVIPSAAPRATLAPALRARCSAGERAGKSAEGYEPLHAVYRRETCLPAIEAAIDADQWKVIAWFPQVKVRVLTPKEIKEYDPSGLAFWNVNTPEEFSKAETLAQSSA
jgi:molybdopterin-guanine dinucleotide biosynthesis protein A